MTSRSDNLYGERPAFPGRYRSLEVRGEGAFGTVEVAWDKTLHRRVAIKHIALPTSQDAQSDTAQLAIQEARTAANLDNPHIVTVLDFELSDSEALIIMENIDGVTLSELMRSQTELLDLDTVAVLLDGVARALICAHKHGVLHLDIKPDNILIDHQGNVKVTDFGLARLVGAAQTASPPRGGSVGYMPPEQIALGELDARTDIWALAALAYTLLTGVNPFLAATPDESLALIAAEDYDLPTFFNGQLDMQVDEVIAQSLSPKPDVRPDTVAELYNVLQPCLGSLKAGKRQLRALVNAISEPQNPDAVGGIGDVGDVGDIGYVGEPELVDDKPSLTGTDSRRQRDDDDTGATEVSLPQMTPYERLSARTQTVLARLIAFIGAAAMAWLGMSALFWSTIDQPALVAADAQVLTQSAVTLAVGIVSLLAPSLGVVLALATLCFAVFVVLGILPGIVLALLSIVWWLLVGRVSKVGATTLGLVPLGMALMAPSLSVQLSGYFLPLKHVLPTALFSVVLGIAVAALTGAEQVGASRLAVEVNILYAPAELLPVILGSPLTWLTGLAWLAASVVVHLFARFGTRVLAFIGVLLAGAVQVVVIVALPMLLNVSIDEPQLLPQILLVASAFVVMAAVAIIGISPYKPPAIGAHAAPSN